MAVSLAGQYETCRRANSFYPILRPQARNQFGSRRVEYLFHPGKNISDEKNLGTLAKRVLFLTISCSRFGNIRKSNVELNTTANHSRFATNKKLLVSPELKQIAKRDEEVKHQVERFLLPYKVGCSILPCASAMTVRTILNDYKKVERPALEQADRKSVV